MTDPDRSVEVAITWRHALAPHLFRLRTERPAGLAFAPGQFVRLGVNRDDGEVEWRAYSIASAPSASELEFYSIVVPDGPFTQPLARLAVDDRLRVDRTVYGFLRADRFVDGRDLWLLATGTGIAPFASLLADDMVWRRFDDIVVVHGVRTVPELAYRDEIEAAGRTRAGARLHYLPTLTGPEPHGFATGRIPALLESGRLEAAAGLAIADASSRLMVCGNPAMIRDVRALLAARGLAPVRRDRPGQFIVENFW